MELVQGLKYQYTVRGNPYTLELTDMIDGATVQLSLLGSLWPYLMYRYFGQSGAPVGLSSTLIMIDNKLNIPCTD